MTKVTNLKCSNSSNIKIGTHQTNRFFTANFDVQMSIFDFCFVQILSVTSAKYWRYIFSVVLPSDAYVFHRLFFVFLSNSWFVLNLIFLLIIVGAYSFRVFTPRFKSMLYFRQKNHFANLKRFRQSSDFGRFSWVHFE